MTLGKSWLIQRLEDPQGFDNPFNFGGGLRNGGLNEDAMSLLRPIFSFDYMGAAEFEFGALPKSLNRLADSARKGTLTRGEVTVELKKVPKNWMDDSTDEPTGTATVYFICDEEIASDLPGRVKDIAYDKVSLKERSGFPEALRPRRKKGRMVDFDTRTKGGIDIKNDFFIFLDKGMADKTADLFGVQ